jgi:hypothetical protein
LMGQEETTATAAVGGCGEELVERRHGVILFDSCQLSVISC